MITLVLLLGRARSFFLVGHRSASARSSRGDGVITPIGWRKFPSPPRRTGGKFCGCGRLSNDSRRHCLPGCTGCGKFCTPHRFFARFRAAHTPCPLAQILVPPEDESCPCASNNESPSLERGGESKMPAGGAGY